MRYMLLFSLPLVPASIASWGLNLSDRYVVKAVDGFSAAGIYSSGYTAGLIVTAIAVAPFALAWGAAYWEISRSADAPRVFSRVLTVYIVAAVGAAVGLSSIGTDAIRILLGHQFEAARFVVPFSAFSSVLYGSYTIVTTGINLQSQTRWLPFTMGAAAIGNVLLNLTLVPRFGYMGAAYASLFSYAQLVVSLGMDLTALLPRSLGLPARDGNAGHRRGIGRGGAARARHACLATRLRSRLSRQRDRASNRANNGSRPRSPKSFRRRRRA